MKDKKMKCPWCNSIGTTVHHGFSNTVRYGKRQRYKCNKCAHTYYEDTEVK